MKSLLLVSLFGLGSTTTFGASPEIMEEVIKTASRITNIKSITEVAALRCPDCYIVEVYGEDKLGEAYVKVQTKRSGNNINTEIVEASR